MWPNGANDPIDAVTRRGPLDQDRDHYVRPRGAQALLALLLLLVGGLLLTAPAPAYACSCVPGGPQQYVKWSDTIFTGTLSARETSGPTAEFTFAVDQVLDGEVAATAVVRSSADGGSCGLEISEEGRSYLVFASTEAGGALTANLCGGTGPADAGSVGAVERILGPSQPPGTDLPSAPPDDAADAAGDSDGDAGWPVLIALLAIGILAVIVVRALVRRRTPR